MKRRMPIVLLLMSLALSSAINRDCVAQPRIVIGLRHTVNQSHQPFKPRSAAGLTRFSVRDAGAEPDMGFNWFMATGPMSEVGYKQLPPGVVLGLKHSLYQKTKSMKVAGKDVVDDQKTPQGLMRRFGGDIGAPSGSGFYWFETTNPDFNWDLLSKELAKLPNGTIIALRHTDLARKPPIRWKIDGKIYVIDPTEKVVEVDELLATMGLERRTNGDRGPSRPGQGLYWFEKVDD